METLKVYMIVLNLYYFPDLLQFSKEELYTLEAIMICASHNHILRSSISIIYHYTFLWFSIKCQPPNWHIITTGSFLPPNSV